MKNLKLLLIAFAFAALGNAQTVTLTQTTLSAALTSSQTQIFVASGTGIVPSQQPSQFLYVDREAMLVLPSPASYPSTTLNVQRGVNGTAAASHASGTLIYALLGTQFLQGYGDPAGTCVASTLVATPLLQPVSGNISVCNSAGFYQRLITIPEATAFGRTLVSAAYAALNTDQIIAVNTATPVTVTLPAAASVMNGKTYYIKDETGGAGTSTLTVAGTIDGSTNKTITTAYGVLRLYSNGTAWFTF